MGSAAHLMLLGGMAAVFFSDEQAEGWAGAAVLLGGLLVCGGGKWTLERLDKSMRELRAEREEAPR